MRVCVCGAVHFVDGWWWRTLLFPTWGWSTTRWEWWSSMIRVFTDEHPGDRSPSQNHHWEPLQAGICSYHIYILLWWHSHTLLTALTVLLQRLLVWCVLYLCIHAWNVTHWQFVGVKHAVSTRLYKQTRADCSWRVCICVCISNETCIKTTACMAVPLSPRKTLKCFAISFIYSFNHSFIHPSTLGRTTTDPCFTSGRRETHNNSF